MEPKASRRGVLLRHTADRASVAFVLTVFAAHAAVYAFAPTWLAAVAMIPLFLMSVFVAPLNHHHQHLNVFRSDVLNRPYDLVMALVTGIGPHTWVLHHNLGHHVNYLRQPPAEPADESHWTRPEGSQMGRVEYSLHLFFHHLFDVHRVGREHPRQYRVFWLMRIPLYLLIGVLVWHSPYNFLFAFGLPAAFTCLHTCWATYEHHAGQPTDSHFVATVNRINPIYNVMSWNLGYHTAHHMRPGVHWAELPELHREIEPKIPLHQILTTFW
ncbi:MAG: fatty acid desaturase [Deltaproteobacteria bacterium]|nr:fatty acid desaturase [Deltaproteobacteria bacterium]